MTGNAASRSGRPFRALAGLALLFALWLGWRLPLMGARLDAVTGLMVPQLAALPPRLANDPDFWPQLAAAGAEPPGIHHGAIAREAPAPPVLVEALPAPAAQVQPEPPQPIAIGSPPPPPKLPAAASPAAAPPPGNAAFRLAQSAYDRLRDGQRRQAAALFDAALRLQPGNRQWRADRAALGRRWQMGGFALIRDGGSTGPAASPVLGGGQMGGSIALLPDPYARRPWALVVRGIVAADPAGIRSDTAQAGIGLRKTLAPGVTITAERLIAIGSATRGDWTLRLAAGGARGRLNAYGEAGVLASGQAFAGAQASARLLRIGPATLGAGAWASLQTGAPDVWRVDVGPSAGTQWRGIRLQADWRQRVAGNAAPGSGPTVTIATGF